MDYLFLTQSDAKDLREFRITAVRTDGKERLRVAITLQNGDSDRYAAIVFDGVQELSVKTLNAGSILGPLKACDLRDKQLEGIGYKVMDFEEDKLSFLCEGYSVR
jgi:hypothetical protein